MDQLVSTCVFRGAPASVYKGSKGGGLAGQEEARQEESCSLREEDSPPFLVGIGFAEGGKEEREEEGGLAPSPCPIRTKGGRGVRPISGHLSSLPLRPTKAHIPPGGFR